eukprot:3808420-Pyramimonas_sp.AAC.1
MNSFHKLASNRKGAPKSFEDTVFPKLHESGYWPNPVTSIALDQEKTVHLGSWVAVKGAGECKTRYGFVNRFPFRVLNPPNAERLPREFLAKINICYLVQASELPEDVRVPLVALSSTQGLKFGGLWLRLFYPIRTFLRAIFFLFASSLSRIVQLRQQG